MTRNKFSIIVPFYNEKNICRNYQLLVLFLEKKIPNYELILVSDGSLQKYNTSLGALIKKNPKASLIVYAKNQGRGYAVSRGFKRAKGEYLAYIDADLELSPSYLPDIVSLLGKHDVVTASKFHPKSKVESPIFRKLSSLLFNSLVRLVLGSKITDHQIGLKGFRKEVIKTILPNVSEKRWLFDVELLYVIQKYKFSTVEIPVRFRYGFTKIRRTFIYDFLKLCIIIFNIKFRHRNKHNE